MALNGFVTSEDPSLLIAPAPDQVDLHDHLQTETTRLDILPRGGRRYALELRPRRADCRWGRAYRRRLFWPGRRHRADRIDRRLCHRRGYRRRVDLCRGPAGDAGAVGDL